MLDLFSGTARVGHALKGLGYQVVANDHLAYAEVVARCYVAADRDDSHEDARPGAAGRSWANFACAVRRIGSPRPTASAVAVHPAPTMPAASRRSGRPSPPATLHARPRGGGCWSALMEAADRVDSTVGLQMAYLKKLGEAGVQQPLQLRMPERSCPGWRRARASAQRPRRAGRRPGLLRQGRPTSTRPTTSTATWATTTCGNRSCSGTSRRSYGIACQARRREARARAPFNSKVACIRTRCAAVIE